MQKGSHVGELYRTYFCFAAHSISATGIFNQHQTGRGFHPYRAGPLRYNQPFLNGNGDGADGAVAAHGQAAAGFDKQHGHIVLRVVRRVQDAAAHHVVATGLKHEAGTYPIILLQKMLPLFAHVVAVQQRAARLYQTYRVAAGMCVNTMECVGGGFVEHI
jgi:hypothetical protein